MKVLWLTTNRSQRVAQLFDPLRRELAQIADVSTVKGEVWTLKDVARGRRDEPRVDPSFANEHDLIFTDAPFAFLDEAWGKFKVPTAMLIEDQHGPYVTQYVDAALERGIAHVFMRYRHGTQDNLPQIKRARWLPHSIDPTVFRPWASQKTTRVLMTGSSGRQTYPIRASIVETLARHPELGRVVPRPVERDPTSKPRGRAYAEMLSSAQICPATGAIYNYVVAKYFEIPACGTALMSEVLPDLAALGFIPSLHYFPLDRHRSIATQLSDALSNPMRLAEITARGHRLVSTRHTAKIRARELLNQLAEITEQTP